VDLGTVGGLLQRRRGSPDLPPRAGARCAHRGAHDTGPPGRTIGPEIHRQAGGRATTTKHRLGSTDATMGSMGTVGLRELRQDASELVRRVEGGEEIDITVSGRLAARLVPAASKRWLSWEDIADAFHGRPDPDWESDRELIDQSVGNPWDRR
jgi:prevent-host-death family protein